MDPVSDMWVASVVPPAYVALLGPGSLMLIGVLGEKHFTGRLTIFANAAATILYFAPYSGLPWWLPIYVNLSTIFGGVAILSYGIQSRLATIFYQVGWMFSSVITGSLILWWATGRPFFGG